MTVRAKGIGAFQIANYSPSHLVYDGFPVPGFSQREMRAAGELIGTKIASKKTLRAGTVKALGGVMAEWPLCRTARVNLGTGSLLRSIK